MAYIRKSLILLPLVLVVVLPVLIAHYAGETKVSAQTAEAPGSLIWVDAEGRAKLPVSSQAHERESGNHRFHFSRRSDAAV